MVGGMSAPAASKSILIVDDEPAVREVLSGYFEHQYGARCSIETAADGAQALAAVRRRRPALILLDIEMPGMDGIETLRRLQSIDPAIPVIVVTGNTSTKVAGEAIKAGAYSYLPKPFKFQYLDHLAATILGRAAATP
jgi:two-component system nitrogen regulation response regulator NtrX